MSLANCIGQVAKITKFTAAQKKNIKVDADRLYNQYKNDAKYSSLDDAAVKTQAEFDAANYYESKLSMQRFRSAKEISGRVSIRTAAIEDHPRGMAAGMRSLAAFDPTGEMKYKVKPTHFEGYKNHVRNELLYYLDEAIEENRPHLFSEPGNGPNRYKVIEAGFKEVYGENIIVDPKYIQQFKSIQKGWKIGYERLRKAGESYLTREDYVAPFHWDSAAIQRADKKAFIDLMTQKALTNNIEIIGPDGAPLKNAKEIQEFLEYMRDNLVTKGNSDAVKRGIVLNKTRTAGPTNRQLHRVINIKDSATWKELHSKFGRGSVSETYIRSMNNLADEVAQAEYIGPNGWHTIQLLLQEAQDRVDKGIDKLDWMDKLGNFLADTKLVWKVSLGIIDGEGNPRVAAAFASARATTGSTKLGTAFLASAPDFATMKHVSESVGADYGKMLKYYGKLAIDSPERLKLNTIRRRMGFAVDYIISGELSNARLLDDAPLGPVSKLTSKAQEKVLQASFLLRHTDSARGGLQLALLDEFGAVRHLDFDNLPALEKTLLEGHGLDAKAWDLIRNTFDDDIGFLDVYKLPQDTMARFDAMIDDQVRVGIIEPGVFTRAFVTRGAARGTLAREVTQTMTQFLPFTISLTHTYGARLLRNPLLNGNRTKFIASWLTYMTLMGGLSIQLTNLAVGKDLQDMTSNQFWGQAFLKGGGGLFLGEVLQRIAYNSQRKVAMRDIVQDIFSLGGPVGGMAIGTISSVAALASYPFTGKESNQELVNILKMYTPGGNLWYARLALERWLYDQIQLAVDPDAEQAWEQVDKRMQKQSGQERYWEKGSLLPSRFPTIAEEPEQ